MNAHRILKVVAVLVSAVIAAAALVLLWSVNYAAAVFVVSGQSNIWAGFTSGHLLLPLLQAWTWWGLPVVSKLITLANAGLTVEAAIIGGSGYLLIATPWKVPMPRDGSRIATLADLRKAKLLNGKPGYSMLLGTFQGHDVRYSGDSHFYVNGPTRSGKGRGFVMPNLLEWRGSAVVLDVKQENLKHTGAARIALGQKIYVIAPGSPKSHCWNPLDVAIDRFEQSRRQLGLLARRRDRSLLGRVGQGTALRRAGLCDGLENDARPAEHPICAAHVQRGRDPESTARWHRRTGAGSQSLHSGRVQPASRSRAQAARGVRRAYHDVAEGMEQQPRRGYDERQRFRHPKTAP